MSSWFKDLFGQEDKSKNDTNLKTTPQEENSAMVQPNGDINPKDMVSPSSSNQPKVETQPNRIFIPKPLEVNTKLTIILIENTEEVAKEKDKLEQIVESLVKEGKVCVINYGRVVRESKIVEAKDFNGSYLLYQDDIGEDACMFDALLALQCVVEENYKKSEKLPNKIVKTNSIDIIGIGRCIDNCSITSGETAIESLVEISVHRDLTTKYFCLTEESFVRAATIGFHSIGAIARNYM